MGVPYNEFCCRIRSLQSQITALAAAPGGGGTYTAGDGLDLNVNEFSVDPGVARKSLTLAQFTATSSNQLAALITDETGTGNLVFGNQPNLTSPQINSGLRNSVGDRWLDTGAVASPVNYTELNPSATGNQLQWVAQGSDANVGINIVPKGSGTVSISGSAIQTASTLATALTAYLTTATASLTYVTLTGAQTVSDKALTLVTQTTLASSAYVNVTASRSLTNADNGKILRSNFNTDLTLNVPAGLTLPFTCGLKAINTGKLILSVSGGTVLKNIDTHNSIASGGGFGSIDWESGSDVWLYGRTAV